MSRSDVVTTPPADPFVVTWEDLKAHSRIDEDDDQAAGEGYILAAQRVLEEELNRAFLDQGRTLSFDAFPAGDGELELSIVPATAVSEIRYVDVDGDAQVLDAAAYQDDIPAEPARIQPKPLGANWPATDATLVAGCQVDYQAGYRSAADVPAPLRQAVLLLAAHWYEHRESVVVGTTAAELPDAVDRLIGPFRMRFNFGDGLQ